MIPTFLSKNWKLKIFAFITAVFMWVFVSQSISETKTIAGVPIRIIHLPYNKTVRGILPTGYLSSRVTLTLSGTRRVIDDLEAGDVEVLLDASTFDSDDYPVQITKKNLISLTPDVDLKRHVTGVDHPELTLKLSQLVTASVPVHIRPPIGTPPEGYEFLDVFPQHLVQTITGPEDEIEKLKQKGLKLTFNFNDFSKQDLDVIACRDDEVCFFPPAESKQVLIPLDRLIKELVNDPRADQIRIDFLRKTLHSLEKEVPIQIFYPHKWIQSINPRTHRLTISKDLIDISGVSYLRTPLLVKNVSRSFLEFIQDQVQIVLIAAPKEEREQLLWSVEVIKPQETEDAYVAYQITRLAQDTITTQEVKEELLRKRFRDYLRKMSLWITPDRKLNLAASLEDNRILVEVR